MASTALAVALVGGAAAPASVLAPVASAHSVLTSVDPPDGATLDTPPEKVSLEFNEEINQMFASVAVTSGADRANLVVGEPVVDGQTVTVTLDDLADGSYTVGFRVTSSDGHVVSGSSVFTVESDGGPTSPAGAPGSPGAAPGSESDAGPGSTGQSTDAGAVDEASAEDPDDASSGINPALWVVGGLAVLLIGGAFFLLRRGN